MMTEDTKRSIPFWLFCIILLIASACQPINSGEKVLRTDAPAQPASVPTQARESQTAQQNPATEASTSSKSDQMPVFLEVIQTTSLGKNNVQGSIIGVGPATYFYNPDSKVLTLNPGITLDPATELIIGVNEVLQTPDQVFEKREIFQNPPVQPDLIQIVMQDLDTGTLTIAFAGEQFDLAPGEKRSFKQQKTNSPSIVIIISNYGELKEIQPILYDGSLR